MKGGSVHEIDEICDEYLDEIHNNNKPISISLQSYSFFDIHMELAMEIISNDKTVRTNTVHDLKDLTQSLATQVEKGEQLFSMKPAIKKSF